MTEKTKEDSSKEEIQEIRNELRRINDRLDTLFSEMTSTLRLQNRALIRSTVGPRWSFEISDAMKKTLSTVIDLCEELEENRKIGRVTAEDVARETHRAPTLESGYLSRLAKAGYLEKERDGKTMYYRYVA